MNSTETMTHEETLACYHKHLGKLASAGMAAKARRGHLPGCAPVGYLNGRDGFGNPCVVIDGAVAPLVREAFGLAAEGTMPLRKILAVMTEKGLRSRNGNPLGVSVLWSVLTNPFYTGSIRYGGEMLPGRHEPIVDARLFGQVQTRLVGGRKRI